MDTFFILIKESFLTGDYWVYVYIYMCVYVCVYVRANIEKRFSFFSSAFSVRRFCCINVDIFVTMYVGRRVYVCLHVPAIVLGYKKRRSSRFFSFSFSSSFVVGVFFFYDNLCIST